MYREINQLIKLSQEGCQVAKEDLLRRLKPLILNSIKNYYNRKDEYEDLIQEGYEVVLRALREYDPSKGARFLGYLKLQLKYHYLNKYKEKREKLTLNLPLGDGGVEILDLIESSQALPLEGLIKRESSQELGKTLDCLTKRQKQIIIESYINELSLKEISQKLQLSYRTVANTKSSALKRLRESLVKKKDPFYIGSERG